MTDTVTVPEYITVHLGKPSASAANVTVPFSDYIKNVASCEIYPTWHENALRANIIAQISLALNRVYNEYYRSRGYDFDITNSTQYDQAFKAGREYYENISRIVDEIFNTYVVVRGSVQPYYTEYCDGEKVTCRGLSQWGSVRLAEQGYTPYRILQYYYGDDIDLKKAQTAPNVPSYPGRALRLGDAGEEVRTVQKQLERIRQNYPLIPKIPEADGIFGKSTENAVRAFQKIFDLAADGVVGIATWYAIKRIYNAVKRLSELFSEGISVSEASRIYPKPLRSGNKGFYVRLMQYYLDFIAYFNNELPRIAVDGSFGKNTLAAVKAFQRFYGVPVTGIIDNKTWYAIIDEYKSILRTLPHEYSSYLSFLYPGYVITEGSDEKPVRQIQTCLKLISRYIPEVPSVEVDGLFGPKTKRAVEAVQRLYGIPVTGSVGALTWNAITELYSGFASVL